MSRALGVSFAPHGFLLRVYDQEGLIVPLSSESRSRVAALGEENEQLRAQLRDLADAATAQVAERERQIAALEAELRRLRGE